MRTNGEVLKDRLGTVLRVGEVPYQANRRAAEELHKNGDFDKGLDELDMFLRSADSWIKALRGLEGVARETVRKAATAFR